MLFNRVLLPTLGRPTMTTWTPSLSLSPRRWSARWFCISPLSLSTAAVTTSKEQLRHYYMYLKWTTQTLLPQENNSDVTTHTSSEQLRLTTCTSSEQLRQYNIKRTTQTLLPQTWLHVPQVNKSDIITSRKQLRHYYMYLKWTTQTLLPQVNNLDVTTSREQLRHYYMYLEWKTQTLLPQENNSVSTTSREQLRCYYLKWDCCGGAVG